MYWKWKEYKRKPWHQQRLLPQRLLLPCENSNYPSQQYRQFYFGNMPKAYLMEVKTKNKTVAGKRNC